VAHRQINYGAVLPGGTAPDQLELARLAESAGWDGVFVWEAAYGPDAWSMLAAMAARTERVRLGTMLTPLPWRRPWKVASQVATLDQLSGGRAILAAGVGATSTGLPDTGEARVLRDRAEMLDEGIDLIRMLWAGGTSFHGRHYDYETSRLDLTRAASPVQRRIPIWVVGVWPALKSMRRALRCDGVIPEYRPIDYQPVPSDASAVRTWLSEQGASDDFDIIADGETSALDQAAADSVAAWADAGCTWWLETRWDARVQMAERLAVGPPRAAIRSSFPARGVEAQDHLDDRALADRLRSLHRHLDGH